MMDGLEPAVSENWPPAAAQQQNSSSSAAESSERPADRQQSNIRNILEQVKSGQKNKSEAFHELRNILQSTVRKTETEYSTSFVPGSEPGEMSTASTEQTTSNTVGNDGPRFTNEDRRLLINHIIERKKRSEEDTVGAQGSLDPDNDTLPTSTLGAGMHQHQQHRYSNGPHGDDEERPISPSSSISGATRSLSGNHSRSNRQRSASAGHSTRRYTSNAQPMGAGDEGAAYSDGRSREEENADYSYGPRNNNSSGYSGYDVRRYEEDGYPGRTNAYPGNEFFSDARSNRMVRHEASIREEMFKECSFKPKIKGLPASYGIGKAETVRDGPFFDRVMRWQNDKEKACMIKKQQVDRSALLDCTFQPRMNPNSERAVKEIRGQSIETNMPSGERLYRNSEAVYMMRARTIEEELRRERSEEDQQCTFQPTLEAEKYPYVKSKFLQYRPRPHDPEVIVEQRSLKNCTFTPKIKGINKHMASAKLYLSTNVVDRLTRSGNTPTEGGTEGFSVGAGGNNVMDVASFMTSRSQHSGSGQGRDNQSYETPYEGDSRGRKFAGSGGRRRASSAPRMGGERSFATTASRSRDDQLTAEEWRERDPRLLQFLENQQKSTLHHQKHLKELKSSLTPTFRPELCRKSLEMSEQHFKGEFLDRVERDVLRRTDAEQRAVSAKDYFCTFHPKLSKKVENMKPRSVYEMSRGDLLRRETSHRMMKLRIEREDVAQLTFQPEISKVGKKVKSSLKLHEDPAFFLQHYEGLEKGKAHKRQQEEQQRIARELELCTFSPQTRDCPAYVKRIARSMHALKASKSVNQSASSTQSKPSFRFGL